MGITEDGGPDLAPATFIVGQEVPNGPVVKEIKYVPLGNAWYRRPMYEVYFDGSTVKRIIPESDVLDIAVETANQEGDNKRKKKVATLAGEPDLSIVTSD
jgi:hypothetical protein